MEKVNGRQLVDVWGEMDQLQQFKLIQNLVRLESQLASIEFPGYNLWKFVFPPFCETRK